MEQETTQYKTITIEAKTLSELKKDMGVLSDKTARKYLRKIGFGKPANGGNIYSPLEVETALRLLGYIK